MPVCITGMHRSGTSLVANLMRLCGLYLGDTRDLIPASADNKAGYWEHLKFMTLNDEILAELGGTWDFPPVVTNGWAETERLNALRVKAELLLEEFRDREPWGWKDPRNCLTLPFWTSLGSLAIPFWYGFGSRLKLVVCIRNPFEVFSSLRHRQYTPNTAGLELWSVYNRSILNYTLPEDRIVTHYEAYFNDANIELRRVLKFLDINVSDEVVERAVAAVSDELRHERSGAKRVSDEAHDSEMLELYLDLCREARFSETVGAGK